MCAHNLHVAILCAHSVHKAKMLFVTPIIDHEIDALIGIGWKDAMSHSTNHAVDVCACAWVVIILTEPLTTSTKAASIVLFAVRLPRWRWHIPLHMVYKDLSLAFVGPPALWPNGVDDFAAEQGGPTHVDTHPRLPAKLLGPSAADAPPWKRQQPQHAVPPRAMRLWDPPPWSEGPPPAAAPPTQQETFGGGAGGRQAAAPPLPAAWEGEEETDLFVVPPSGERASGLRSLVRQAGCDPASMVIPDLEATGMGGEIWGGK